MFDKELILEHLGILVTTYCNLNCRDCADLIPKRAHRHYELDNMKSDLSIVLENVDYIKEILVIGGETLVYPWLLDVLDFCRSQKKVGKLIITTNGVMIPGEELLENFRKNEVAIRVSGYPEYVVPNRKKALETYRSSGLEIEDLENMVWYDVGRVKKRHRTEEGLKRVFSTCAMKSCVALNQDGKIFFCSRQMAADEKILYPEPLENEFVNVRTEKDVRKKLEEFYRLPYVTTCDYCDGISCETKKVVPTAAQILKKGVFLELLSLYFEFTTQQRTGQEKITAVTQLLQCISNNIDKLHGFQSVMEIFQIAQKPERLIAEWDIIIHHFLVFINEVTGDYDYDIRVNSPYALSRRHNAIDPKNTIIVSDHKDDITDVLIEEQEIIDAVNRKWPMDLYVYGRLFITSKLEKIKSKAVKCIVCGLSYTQYGILEKEMPVTTCNLSVTGQDIPYSILMAEKALEYNSGIETVVIPMAYFQCCYDMSSDDAQLHKDVISYINMPILGESRNYTGEKQYYKEQMILEMYNHIYDLEKIRQKRDKEIMDHLKDKEFFNEIFPEPLYGGLKFDFKALCAEEKQASAWITAQHNERVCTLDGYKEVAKYLSDFLRKTEQRGVKVLFFVPPATRYLVNVSCAELKNFYYENIVAKFSKMDHVRFLDLFDDKRFEDNDFSDFEHLNHAGAKNLTQIIGEAILEWSSSGCL